MAEDEEEYVSYGEEFAGIVSSVEESRGRLVDIAKTYQAQVASGDKGASIGVNLIGEMRGLLEHAEQLARACAAVTSEIEERVGALEDGATGDDSRLTVEDAEQLHLMLRAFEKLLKELLDKGASEGDARAVMDGLLKSVHDRMEWVLEVSEYDPEEPAEPEGGEQGDE